MNLDKKTRVALLVLALIVFLGGTYYLTSLIFRQGANASFLARRVDSVFSQTLSTAGAKASEMRKNYVRKHDGKSDWEQIEVVVTLDQSQSIYSLSRRLRDSLDIPALAVTESGVYHNPPFNELQLSVYFDRLPIYQMLLRQESVASIPAAEKVVTEEEDEPPKMALVVDDVGYDIERALELLNLRRPMTISIFPQLRYSRHIAEVAHNMGYEVMMHLPMEPGERLRRNPGFITSNMDEKALYWVLDRDFESIPYVVGVNNHQGSRMTSDPAAMARVMRYLAKKNVFFIDSRTTSDSVAYQVAKTFGLQAAENDVFLDNEKDVEYIKERIELLMQEAEEKGAAVGICHVHPATMQALREMFPVIDERGIETVYASELVH